MNRCVERNYYLAQLRADALNAPDAVIARRAEALGIMATSGSAKLNRRERSPEMAACHQRTIDTVRTQFWTMAIDDLKTSLESIDLSLYPELATVVTRLTRAADARDDFPKASAVLKSNHEFFQYLRASITAAPREYAGMREMVSRKILAGNQHRAVKKSADLIQSRFPRIHAIDPAWFSEIKRTRPPGNRFSGVDFSLPANVSLPVPGWLLFLGLYMILQLFRLLSR